MTVFRKFLDVIEYEQASNSHTRTITFNIPVKEDQSLPSKIFYHHACMQLLNNEFFPNIKKKTENQLQYASSYNVAQVKYYSS